MREEEIQRSGGWGYVRLADGTAQIRECPGDAKEASIPERLDGLTVTAVGEEAFQGRNSLTSVTIPDPVRRLGPRAFAKCRRLASVRLPAGLEEIPDECFADCRQLKDIAIPGGVTRIGSGAFTGCAMTEITIPDSVALVGDNPFCGCPALKRIHLAPGHPVLKLDGEALYSRPDRRLVSYPRNPEATEYDIVEGTRVIGGSAFYRCRRLTRVGIPDSVTEIGSIAFCRSGLTEIQLPGGLRALGRYAFADCDALGSMLIPEGVDRIPFGLCAGCERLALVSIPEGVTAIGDGAFCGCPSLDLVLMPRSVTEIGHGAFDGCPVLHIAADWGTFAHRYCWTQHIDCIFRDRDE